MSIKFLRAALTEALEDSMVSREVLQERTAVFGGNTLNNMVNLHQDISTNYLTREQSPNDFEHTFYNV
jgi:hypothetical protein